MILMLSPWHIVILLALFVGWYAAIVSTGIILLLHGVYRQIERENDGWEQAKREKRSAAALRGWQTRKRQPGPPPRARFEPIDSETERVLRQLDEQAEAKQIVQGGEDQ